MSTSSRGDQPMLGRLDLPAAWMGKGGGERQSAAAAAMTVRRLGFPAGGGGRIRQTTSNRSWRATRGRLRQARVNEQEVSTLDCE